MMDLLVFFERNIISTQKLVVYKSKTQAMKKRAKISDSPPFSLPLEIGDSPLFCPFFNR